MNTPLYRLEAHFSGRVQGVGFRYTARQIAKGFEVTGRVCNLPDGRVNLVAEGSEKEVMAFVDEIRSQMAHYIKETETHAIEGASQYRDFHIG